MSLLVRLLAPLDISITLIRIEDDPTAPQIIFPIFAFLRGVGNITSGPISDALLKLDTLRGGAGAYGFRNYVRLCLRPTRGLLMSRGS